MKTEKFLESNVQSLINTAVQKHQLGKLDEAEFIYRQILQIQPDCDVGKVASGNQYNLIAITNLGNALQQQGKLEEAVESYQQAINLKPDAGVYNNLGIIFQRQGKLEEAIESYQQAISLKPELAEAYQNLGNALQQQNKLDEAIDSYQQAINLKPDPGVYNNLGNVLRRQGNLDEAIDSYHQAIHLKPDLPQAYHNLGNALQRQNKLDEAIDSYQQAIHLKPDPGVYNNLGNALQQQGKLDEAVESYQQAIALKPNLTEAYQNLGNALQQQGKLDEAIDSYQQVLHLKPDAVIYNNLGNAFKEQGKLDEAVGSYQQALQLKPGWAQAHYNLGNAFKEEGKLEEAVESYQQALQLKPDAVIYNNLGNAFKEEGKLEEAVESYQQALQLKPDWAQAHYNLGNALQQQGKLEEAVESYQQALQIKPDAGVYNNLGNALQEQGKLEEAVESYQQALRLEPDAVVYNNLGNALKEQCQLEAAVESYEQAIRLQPDLGHAKFSICMSQLPIIYSSYDEIRLRRNQYQQQLQKLAQSYQEANQQERAKAAEAVGSSQPFYLAYQGLNDRDLQRTYGEMICQLMSSRYPQWSQPTPIPTLEANEKIRVGFVSGFFRYHSVWKIPIKGWIENLDRNKFELFGYHTDSTQDQLTAGADQAFVKFIQGPLTIEKWCEAIARDKLHVLIFPEFGMDPVTIHLGCLRLAPIQMTSWGHPDTSGLPTIDYYLSSDLMEPDNAQEHYTEKLVRLPNLSIYYTPLSIQPQRIDRKDIGLEDDDIMFLCCQSLFKYLPQYDDVFPLIARELARSKFVFFEFGRDGKITEIFRQRLNHAFQEFGLNAQDYCVFLPRQNVQTFAGTMILTDVFLDGIGFSGANTALEAIAHNLPIVTLSGDLMRGRLATGILKMMGVEETIASSKNEYVKIAIRLGQDSQYRQYISQQVAENKHKLYGDLKPVRALEEFLVDTVQQKITQHQQLTETTTSPQQVHKSSDCAQATIPSKQFSLENQVLPKPLADLSGDDLSKLALAFGTDKEGAHHYTKHYQFHFESLRREKLNILEIGIGGYENPRAGGESLRMWKAYFPNSRIFGIDICDKTYHDEDRIKTFKGSQVDEKFLQKVVEEIGEIDIIIDDGSHYNHHVIATFKILFPLMNHNGIYVIEDLQTSYWQKVGDVRWGGSKDLAASHTSMNFLKGLIDGLNYEEFTLDEYTPSYFDEHIISMHFYHNLAFIYKGLNNEGSNILGKRCYPEKERRVGIPTLSENLKLAVEHHRANRLDQAQEIYNQILEQQPQHPDALYGLGVLTQQTGQYQSAEKFLKALLHIQPESVRGWLSLGNLRQVQDQLPEAVEAYEQALAIQPDSVAVHNNLGYTRQLQGKWEEAITCYQKALELQPDCAEAEANLGNALYAQGKLSPEKQAQYAELNYDLGVACEKAGDLKTAVAYYRQALSLKPNAEVYNKLGNTLQQQGKLDEAKCH